MARKATVYVVQPAPSPADAFQAFVGAPAKPRRYRGTSERVRRQLEDDLVAALDKGDLSDLKGGHFVLAYERMFADFYKIPVPDFDGVTRAAAIVAAQKMLEEKFHNNPPRMAAYLEWVFAREQSREAYRAAEIKRGTYTGSARPIGWILVFKKEVLFSDWFVEQRRRATARPT